MNELQATKQFFDIAIPDPTIEQRCIQIGCHIEEFAEMFEALGVDEVAESLHAWANYFKLCTEEAMLITRNANRLALADSMGDQIVTATGVMNNFKMDALSIVRDINRSNFSKFENGKPVFDENGKITKGKDYSPPNLTPFV